MNQPEQNVVNANGVRIFIVFLLLNTTWLYAQTVNPVLLTAHFAEAKNKVAVPLWKKEQVSVWFFFSPECPMCQNYAPTLKVLAETFVDKVHFIGIIPGIAYTSMEIESYRKTYQISFPLVVDSAFKVSNLIKATVTPEVFVVNQNGQLAYSGAIDNWLYGLGKKRRVPTEHFLKNALEEVIAGKSVTIPKTTAKGCRINDF
jgi:thiol-disulfide isomerase/thioredoxin